MKKLFVISAPSGAGKTTLCQRLLKDFSELTLSISSTTRPPRGKEKDSVDYFFITEAEFKKKAAGNRFAEWAIVHGNDYGTSKDFIEESLARGKCILLDIDIQGAESLRKSYPNLCYTLFISPPDLTALEKRLRSRGTDNETTIQERLKNAREELREAKKFDQIILNDDLEKAYSDLKRVLESQLPLKTTKGTRG